MLCIRKTPLKENYKYLIINKIRYKTSPKETKPKTGEARTTPNMQKWQQKVCQNSKNIKYKTLKIKYLQAKADNKRQ